MIRPLESHRDRQVKAIRSPRWNDACASYGATYYLLETWGNEGESIASTAAWPLATTRTTRVTSKPPTATR